jgi:hypothetical protein
MIHQLCGGNESKWEESLRFSRRALELRIKLWDGIYDSICNQKTLTHIA